eukprot:scaffold8053_cov60-Attheya_sp.AAC.5
MARTNRRDAEAAPQGEAAATASASAADMDKLDLDDLFGGGEGGDFSLFDDFGDMDGMGDLGGAPQGGEGNAGGGASNFTDLLTFEGLSAEVVAAGEEAEKELKQRGTTTTKSKSSKKKKTSRKSSNVPAASAVADFGDDDSDTLLSKTKTRGGTRKKKSTDQDDDDDSSSIPSSTTSKRKTKTKKAPFSKLNSAGSTMSMPPPTSRTGGTVAKAGRFGGQQKRGTGLPGSTKSKNKSKSSSIMGPPMGVGPLSGKFPSSPSTSSLDSPHKKGRGRSSLTGGPNSSSQFTNTYCGLEPSDKLFYPYLPTIPPEPSMKRVHRIIPLLDKIRFAISAHHQSQKQQQQHEKDAANLSQLDKNGMSALLKLLQSESDPNAPPGHGSNTPNTDDNAKSIPLTSSNSPLGISKGREALKGMQPGDVVAELRMMLALIGKQHGFLSLSLENMQRWCKLNFSEENYLEAYEEEKVVQKDSKQQHLVGPHEKIASMRFLPVVKIRIKGVGLKNGKNQLIAHMPLPPGVRLFVPPPASTPAIVPGTTKNGKVISTTKVVSKKRTLPETSAIIPNQPPPPPYADMTPTQRREYTIEVIHRRTTALQTEFISKQQSLAEEEKARRRELNRIVENDELVMVNTLTLWQYIEQTKYFANYTQADIYNTLLEAWQPESIIPERLPSSAPCINISNDHSDDNTNNSDDDDDDSDKEEPQQKRRKVLTTSIFDRLESLLVEEDASSDDESDDSDEDDDDMFLSTVTSSHHGSKIMMDLSGLSLDQRTFVELRANGLVDSHVLPREPHVIEDFSSSHSSQADEGDSKEDEEKEDSIDEVIWNMQVDLSRQHRANNLKTARLQSAATAHLSKIQKDLQIEEENSARIARYTQLLKRQKEAKKVASAKQKNVKKDQDWIPW